MLSYHTCPLAALGGKDTGGMNVYVRELTKELGVKGIHVDVFTRSQDEHIPRVLHDLGYGNRVVHISSGPELFLSKQTLQQYLPGFVKGVIKFVERKGIKYDAIHSHYWLSGIAAEELKSEWGIPVVQMFHTLGIMKQRISLEYKLRDGEYRINGEKRVIEMADRIIAATPAEVSQLQWLYHANPKKIVTIPPGVDTSHFYPIPNDEAKDYIGIPRNEKMVLFVGRIEPLKGIDSLIKAISLIKRDDFPLCLVVIGGEPSVKKSELSKEMERLIQKRNEYGVGDVVTFLGKRDQDTLPYYYSAAEAVVVPSHYESFGMVALEAMACGTPVIASNVGGLAFLVQDGVNGFSIPVGDSELMAKQLNILLTDKLLNKEMGMKASKIAKEYSWDKIADKITQVYESVINQG